MEKWKKKAIGKKHWKRIIKNRRSISHTKRYSRQIKFPRIKMTWKVWTKHNRDSILMIWLKSWGKTPATTITKSWLYNFENQKWPWVCPLRRLKPSVKWRNCNLRPKGRRTREWYRRKTLSCLICIMGKTENEIIKTK